MVYMIGINAADLFMAKKKDVINGRLEYKRAKTGKLYSIQITPEARANEKDSAERNISLRSSTDCQHTGHAIPGPAWPHNLIYQRRR